MSTLKPILVQPESPLWPHTLTARLGAAAPSALQIAGPAEILAEHRLALFCSARTPGAAILRAHDAARRFRDSGMTVISGFHSPIERECLKILLRGRQPIIVCPARAIDSMQIPSEIRDVFEAGRILFLSPFAKQPRRVTAKSAVRRNQVVAALADEAYVAHIEGGSKTERIVTALRTWSVPVGGPERRL